MHVYLLVKGKQSCAIVHPDIMDGITVRIDQAIVIVMTFYSVMIYPKKIILPKIDGQEEIM